MRHLSALIVLTLTLTPTARAAVPSFYLFQAVDICDLEQAELIRSQAPDTDFNLPSPLSGRFALELATDALFRSECVDMARYLIDHGARVNALFLFEPMRQLHFAGWSLREVERGVNWAGHTFTPEELAFERKKGERLRQDVLAVIDLFLAQPELDLNERSPMTGNSALIEALDRTQYSNADTRAEEHARVRRLIELGADVGLAGRFHQRTPLITAARNGDLTMVRLLLEKGASATVLDFEGTQAFAHVLHDFDQEPRDERLAVAELLLQHGSELNPHYSFSGTLLNDLVKRSKLEALKFIIERGARPEPSDLEGVRRHLDYCGADGTNPERCSDASRIQYRAILELLISVSP